MRDRSFAPVPLIWKYFFWAASAYNLVIGAMVLFDPTADLMNRVVGLLVGCFGIIYALVARDPVRFVPVLWAGVVGKIGVSLLFWPGIRDGSLPPETGPVVMGDLFFTAGFLLFLWRQRGW